MINVRLINRHSYQFTFMSVLDDGAHEYYNDNKYKDDNFIITMMILAIIMISKCLLPAIDFATCYTICYSDLLSQPYSNPTRSKKKPTRWALAGSCAKCGYFGSKSGLYGGLV